MSSWHFQQLRFALGIGGLMSFYGIIGFLTFTVGPRLGLQFSTQIMVLVVLLLTLPFTLFIGYLATRRARKQEEDEKKQVEEKSQEKAEVKADDSGEKPQKLAAPSGNYKDFPEGAEEVVQFLKSSNLGENGKDAVYSLPWYLVAGMPKTGKSSLVIGSSLNFQTLPSQRQSEMKMIRPTRGVDWRVTSDAVFVDTAGRYQSEGNSDQDEWASLLETIKKARSNRPLDGFLLLANVEKILNSDEREIEEMAKVMRTRLDETMQRLKVRFPVYLIFTHADSIEGFRDSFSTSKKEGETLVWGATIPLENSEKAHSMFDEEFGLLHNSVMKRRLMRLSAPFPPVRQLRIFNFPLHFGSARRKLGAFVSALFRPNPFTENPFLRGYYFTAVPVNRPVAQGTDAPPNIPQTVGITYFTEKLFRDVILRDKDLVRTFQEQRQRPPIFGWLMLMLGATLTFILLLLSGVSLYNNSNLLDTAANRGGTVLNNVKADVNTNLLTKTPEQATTEIQAIENLRLLMIDLDNYERNGAPIYLGMGLYSGNKIYKEKLLPIYYSALARRFVDPAMRRVEDDLRKFAASPSVKNATQLTQEEEDYLGKNYDLLKVYLMLTDKYRDKATETEIVNTLKDYWFTESKLPESLKGDAENQLKFYAKQVDRFEGPDRFPRIQPNGDLVTNVRAKLKVFPPFQRYYRRKVTEISKDVEAKVGAMSVDAIIQRGAGDPGFLEGNYTVPSAYTREGFFEMEKAITASIKELGANDWVMDEKTGVTDVVQNIESPDTGKIRERYFRDYADQWRNFVKGVKVKPYTKATARDALSSFSSNNSPMKVLLKEIERNTNLSKKTKIGWFESIKSWFSSVTMPDTGGNSQVEREFRPLFTFVEDTGDKNKQVPVDEYRKYIESVSTKYNSFTDNEINELGSLQEDQKNQKFPQLKTAIGDVDKITKTFKDLPYFVDLLKQPIGNLSALLGADSIKQIGEKWKNEILPLARKAEQGYPFESGETNADFTNLKEYLGSGKGLSKFYDETLKKYFEGTPGQLKLKDPNNAPFNQEFVDYLNKALVLRQALFSKGDDVKFSYDFELLNPQDTVVEITIDGITISSVDKPASKIDFPASTGGGNGVIIKALSTTGTTSTSGTSANTSSSSVNTSSSSNSSKFLQNSNSSSSSDEKPFLGPWGLFRFMDASNARKESDKIYRISYRLKSGKIVEAKITATGEDPFNKEIYKLRAPENILK